MCSKKRMVRWTTNISLTEEKTNEAVRHLLELRTWKICSKMPGFAVMAVSREDRRRVPDKNSRLARHWKREREKSSKTIKKLMKLKGLKVEDVMTRNTWRLQLHSRMTG